MLIELDVFGTLTAASLVLLAGRKLVASWRVLNTYSIPEPVVGGLAVALLFWLAHAAADVQIRFDSTLGPPLMLAFFACIGLNADLPSLLRGGRPLVVFLGVVLGFLTLQNITGMGLAYALGQSPLVGLLAGSISLSGGHGTGAAWGAVFAERYGLASAKEIAIAAATFGLVLGGVIGGPVARHLLT
ncbi:MAG: sodium/glutamate symporter, partial [Burkholderiaceae bacterium]